MRSNFALMASYNQFMNNKLYQEASELSVEQLALERGAFFGSILATLNHILVADTIWLKRFATHQFQFPSLEVLNSTDTPASLNSILHSNFTELTHARSTMDKLIIDFIEELSEQALATPLAYQNTKGIAFKKNFAHLLMHFFNHQTHHRGQASTLLFQAGIDIGVTDLLACISEQE